MFHKEYVIIHMTEIIILPCQTHQCRQLLCQQAPWLLLPIGAHLKNKFHTVMLVTSRKILKKRGCEKLLETQMSSPSYGCSSLREICQHLYILKKFCLIFLLFSSVAPSKPNARHFKRQSPIWKELD